MLIIELVGLVALVGLFIMERRAHRYHVLREQALDERLEALSEALLALEQALPPAKDE